QYDNHNCTKCGRCVDSCHMGALSMDFSLKGSE
ncbi:4Fe-4S binding protein, partial [Candidatus Bipolaricaulota bacterium]|nr:4Fe-4S binding protein [Candidatus Bipolaricaulota bacterium]